MLASVSGLHVWESGGIGQLHQTAMAITKTIDNVTLTDSLFQLNKKIPLFLACERGKCHKLFCIEVFLLIDNLIGARYGVYCKIFNPLVTDLQVTHCFFNYIVFRPCAPTLQYIYYSCVRSPQTTLF